MEEKKDVGFKIVSISFEKVVEKKLLDNLVKCAKKNRRSTTQQIKLFIEEGLRRENKGDL